MIIINIIIAFFLFLFISKGSKKLLKWFLMYKLSGLTKSFFAYATSHTPYQEPPSAPPVEKDTLVECASCGLYVLKENAIERAHQSADLNNL